MKPCNTCKIPKKLSEFNKDKKIKDGHALRCRYCSKIYAKNYAINNPERAKSYRSSPHAKAALAEYEKERYKKPERKKSISISNIKYSKTEKGRISARVRGRRSQLKYPNANKARSLFGNLVIAGKIIRPDRCEECGISCKPDGHHDDYNKPLNVRWLCKKDHVEWHKNNTPLNRK